MKLRLMMTGLLAATLSGLTANACLVQVRVACPNDTTASGIEVCIAGVGCALTDNLGIASITVPVLGETYTVCVNTATLPPGATLSPACKKIKVLDLAPPVLEFVLGGSFCQPPPPQGECWMTGGGQVYKTKGAGDFSFGGVVYPGCSPSAADGGNWNVVDHVNGLHFQGKTIIVDSCSGVSTRSPRVNVNIIDYHGVGTLAGIGGNPDATIPVSFVGRCIDNHDGGSGSDMLFLSVDDGSGVVMQIGNSAADPAVISTGNIQIHTSSCGK